MKAARKGKKKTKKTKTKNSMEKAKNHPRKKKTTSGMSRKWSAGVTKKNHAKN
jgi:hypothetical protein